VLHQYQTLTFTLSLEVDDGVLGTYSVACADVAKCTVKYQRQYTPVLFDLAPPVVYFDSETTLIVDPKATPSLIEDLQPDAKHFINAKIGGALMDFESTITHETSYSHYYRNHIKGRVGDQNPNEDHSVSMLWETGNTQLQPAEALHCNVAEDKCYKAKTVPVIHDMSSHEGYITGGQSISVKGHGFNSGEIDAKLDGVDCVVTSKTDKEFTCNVQEAAQVSTVDVPHIGQHGARREMVDSSLSSSHVWFSNFDDLTKPDWTRKESLSMQLEAPSYVGDRVGHRFKTWFEAPLTTNYRFYMSCDDDCTFDIDQTPMSTSNLTRLLSITNAVGFREYWRPSSSQSHISDWVALEAGENYYLEMMGMEGTGSDHASVAVEIEQSDVVGHHHSMKEVQKLTVNTEQNKDTLKLTILNPDDGKYILNFQDPDDLSKYRSSDVLKPTYSAWDVRNRVKGVYLNKWGAFPSVTLEMFDANDELTEDVALQVKRVYTITCDRLIPRVSTSNVLVAKQTTTSTFSVELPIDVQQSSAPLSGKYRIKCIDSEGYESMSNLNPFFQNANWVALNTHIGCDMFYDRFEVWESIEYGYKENGIGLIFTFQGVNEDVGQFEIVSDEDEPLSGDNMTMTFETIVPYSTNLFYNPIPFEMLRTYETTPQLIVSVNGLPAVCHNLTCDYSYVEPVGEVTAFTFDAATSTLAITGTSFDVSNIKEIWFAKSKCTVDPSTLTATNIDCTLAREPTCGTFIPIVIADMGIIPGNAALVGVEVACTVTGATPLGNLNLLGGDNITISGTNFPHELSDSTVVLNFDDSQTTTCVPQTSTTSTLVCLTGAFDTSSSAGASHGMSISINDHSVSNSLSAGLRSIKDVSLNLNPPSASPVLKTEIVISLESTFAPTLAVEDFTVNGTMITNSTIVKRMNVIAVDDAAKTLTVMFGGAYSGDYAISIRHSSEGLIETDDMILSVTATVTNVSPMTGSIYGGSVLTITGTNFGYQKTDNPVQISFNGGVGSLDCFVLTTGPTEITCMIDDTIEAEDGETGDVVVFLKASEEAVCDSSVCGGFTFTSIVPTITSVTPVYDDANNNWDLVLAGTDFPATSAGIVFEANGVSQAVKSSSAIEVVLTVTDVESRDLANLRILFPGGKPAGHELLEAGLTLSEKLVSLVPASGSVGGTTIIATVPGAGVDSSELSLKVNGEDICESTSVPSYGVLHCKTNKVEYVSADVTLWVEEDQADSACLSSCTYE